MMLNIYLFGCALAAYFAYTETKSQKFMEEMEESFLGIEELFKPLLFIAFLFCVSFSWLTVFRHIHKLIINKKK